MRALLLGLALTLSGCNPLFFLDCAPSRCRQAKDGQARLQPVVDTLASYSAALGTYPDSAAALVPEYLSALPNPGYWQYEREHSTYRVSFFYAGPGMNWCFYRPEDKWRCGGYY